MPDHPGPFLIIEGADGSGKSTLAQQLGEMLGLPVEHYGPPTTYAYDEWTRVVVEANGPRIFDRLHVGSFAYGRQFRGQDDLSPMERWKLDGLLTYYGTKMIYCAPPQSVMEENVAQGERGPHAHYEQRQKKIQQDYDWFFTRGVTANSVPRPDYTTSIPAMTYDYTKDTPERAAEWGQFHTSAEPLPYQTLEGWRVYGNARRPRLRVVVIDDAWDFCPYVAMALRSIGMSWSDLCVLVLGSDAYRANAIDETWVALGAEAAQAVDGEIRVVPDPLDTAEFHFQEGLIRYPLTILGKDDWSP